MLTILINRSVLKPEESLASFIIRLNRINYYQSMNRIDNICRSFVPRKAWQRPDPLLEIKLISKLSLVSVDDLYDASLHRFSQTLMSPKARNESDLDDGKLPLPQKTRSYHLWHRKDTPYCPQCVAEDPYHRLSWLTVGVTSCEHHQCLLQRGCPNCHKPVSVVNVSIDCCEHCDFKLSEAETADLSYDPVGLEAQAILRKLLFDGDQTLVPDVDPAVLYHVIFGLGRACQTIQNRRGLHQPPFPMPDELQGNKTSLRVDATYVLMTTAVHALQNWPHNFHHFLANYAQDEQGQCSDLVQQDFGRLYVVWLERSWRDPAYQFVQDAFDDFLCTNYVISPSFLHLRRVRENPILLDRLPCLTEAETARMLGVSNLTVKKLVEQKKLRPYQAGENRFNLLHRASVLQRLTEYEDTLTLTETADLFGLSDRVIVDLIQANMLEAVRGPTIDESMVWYVSRPAAYNLLKVIRQGTTKLPLLDMVPLRRAVQIVSAHDQNMLSVIERLLMHKMRAFWMTNALPDIAVSAEDLQVWLAELREDRPFISRSQFAKQMKVKRLHIIDTWVASGLITPLSDPNESPMYFKIEDVEQFMADHVWTDTAAQIMEVGKLTVQKWARHGRLHPVSGREVDGLHRYLFKRDEVERFRPENRVTAPQMAERLGIGRSQMLERIKCGRLKPISGPQIDNCKQYLFLLSNLG